MFTICLGSPDTPMSSQTSEGLVWTFKQEALRYTLSDPEVPILSPSAQGILGTTLWTQSSLEKSPISQEIIELLSPVRECLDFYLLYQLV